MKGSTLRTVTPWFHNDRLIGYLELGMEIGHLYRKIEQTLGVTLEEAIDTNLISSNLPLSPESLYKVGRCVEDGSSAALTLNNRERLSTDICKLFARDLDLRNNSLH